MVSFFVVSTRIVLELVLSISMEHYFDIFAYSKIWCRFRVKSGYRIRAKNVCVFANRKLLEGENVRSFNYLFRIALALRHSLQFHSLSKTITSRTLCMRKWDFILPKIFQSFSYDKERQPVPLLDTENFSAWRQSNRYNNRIKYYWKLLIAFENGKSFFHSVRL